MDVKKTAATLSNKLRGEKKKRGMKQRVTFYYTSCYFSIINREIEDGRKFEGKGFDFNKYFFLISIEIILDLRKNKKLFFAV